MSATKSTCALVLGALLAGCAEPAPPPPPPPENIFAAPVDRILVKGAMTDTANHPTSHRADRFRALVISDDPKGQWRAVCGQASSDGTSWKDFVALAAPGPAISSLAVRGDKLTPEKIPVCKALVQKYLGERVPQATAEKAFADAGCWGFDDTYWWAWKSYCQGNLTQPSPTPAAPQ